MTIPTPPSVSEVLEKAADLIEPPGNWMQGEWTNGVFGSRFRESRPTRSCWCVEGALADALGVHPGSLDAHPAYQALADHLKANPSVWNDAPGRTQSEVVSALRAAASKAREASHLTMENGNG